MSVERSRGAGVNAGAGRVVGVERDAAAAQVVPEASGESSATTRNAAASAADGRLPGVGMGGQGSRIGRPESVRPFKWNLKRLQALLEPAARPEPSLVLRGRAAGDNGPEVGSP